MSVRLCLAADVPREIDQKLAVQTPSAFAVRYCSPLGEKKADKKLEKKVECVSHFDLIFVARKATSMAFLGQITFITRKRERAWRRHSAFVHSIPPSRFFQRWGRARGPRAPAVRARERAGQGAPGHHTTHPEKMRKNRRSLSSAGFFFYPSCNFTKQRVLSRARHLLTQPDRADSKQG